MPDGPVRLERHAGVAHVTLASPTNRNALSDPLLRALRGALAEIQRDDDVRVLLLGHEGPIFCAGSDRNAEPGTGPTPGDVAALFQELMSLRVPTVAFASGGARGGGVALLAAADVVIVADEARFAFPEVSLGLVPAVAALVVTPRLGLGRALALLLTGEEFTGIQGTAWGLFASSVPEDAVAGEAARVTDVLLSAPAAAVAAAKQVVRLAVIDPAQPERMAAIADFVARSAQWPSDGLPGAGSDPPAEA